MNQNPSVKTQADASLEQSKTQILPPSRTPTSNNWLKVLTLLVLILILMTSAAYAGFYLGKKQILDEMTVAIKPTNVPTLTTPMATTTPTLIPETDPTAGWKTYVSPKLVSYFQSFKINYPNTWTIEEKIKEEEPKSLTVTLTNSKQESIKIVQAMGGSGNCVYFDDSDYLSYEGAGQFFSSYMQLNQPAIWRISQFKNKNKTSHMVCEKNQDRYAGVTKIGWIDIDVQSEKSLREVESILKTIVY